MKSTIDLELRLNPRVICSTKVTVSAYEMARIGSTAEGIKIMLPKAAAVSMKLHNLTRLECNILKQAMLSLGADACVHKFVVTEQVPNSDMLLVGTRAQYNILCKRLLEQPWKIPVLSTIIKKTIENYDRDLFKIKTSNGILTLGRCACLMGILNVTPDSFYDGGRYTNPKTAIEKAIQLKQDGADIIDVGGESTRPGSSPVSVKEEINRIIPVIKELCKRGLIVSVDTYKAKVAEVALDNGASIVNDVSGLNADKRMVKTVSRYKVPVVIMHMQGVPKTMQKKPFYSDLFSEMTLYLRQSISRALDAGVAEDKIIIDPGIGFGKLPEHNIQIIKRLSEFRSLGCPILIGTSRKSFIGHYLGSTPAGDRLIGTVASICAAVLNGASIIRAHDVNEVAQALTLIDLLK